MKKLFGLFSVFVFGLMITNAAFAGNSVMDFDQESSLPEASTQKMDGQMDTTGALSTTPLHSVWPFPRSSEPFPGDPETKEQSAIDEVKVDLSLDPEPQDPDPSLPETD
ncbi:MAG: hypothetical protein NPINA01_11740 [Nitrospinaceae bacterium]|nr:MAG: hypothetical protein NPINA01_11740 [Nitrospinaceae bacterium]